MRKNHEAMVCLDGPAPVGRRAAVSAEVCAWGNRLGMRRKGFTLVELLVVVAIVIILAGILYPVFASTRRAAYSAACISNLKQIGLAVTLYSQDYDETFPTACDQIDRHPSHQILRAQPDWPKPTPYAWEVLKPYVKNPGVWRCPGDSGFYIEGGGQIIMDFRPNTYEKSKSGSMDGQSGSSYRYNTNLAWVDPNPNALDPREKAGNYWAPLTVGAIQHPSETFVVAEPAGHWHNSILAPPKAERTPLNDTSDSTYRYNGVHVDGHVKGITLRQQKLTWRRHRNDF
jgi:general secretion pathway protein G